MRNAAIPPAFGKGAWMGSEIYAATRFRKNMSTGRLMRRGLGILLAAGLLAAAAPPSFAQQPPMNFVAHPTPKPVAPIKFENEKGELINLADFRGRVVLLNIWATWCVPCRREMPSLDRLQASLGGSGFEVVALSIDRGGVDVVRKFYTEVGVQRLAIYVDPTGKAPRALNGIGVPMTLLIDREGREIGRLPGPAEWDDPAVVKFLKGVVSQARTGGASFNTWSSGWQPSGRDEITQMKKRTREGQS